MGLNFGDSITYIREYMQNVFALNKMSADKQASLDDGFIEKEYNRLYKTFCTVAKVRKETYSISTTENISSYSLPATLMEIDFVFYESAISIWRLKKIEGGSELAYAKTLSGDDPSYYTTKYQTNLITLYNAPRYDSETITLYGSYIVADLTNDADEPLLPDNFRYPLCDFVIARIQLMAGMLTNEKNSQYTVAQKIEQDVIAAANACRKQIEFKGDSINQLKDLYKDHLSVYNVPIVNHNPIINTAYYLDTLKFYNNSTGNPGMILEDTAFTVYNDSTGAERFKVNSLGAYVNGTLLAFLGARGIDNFAGYTGVTTITIPDQGGITYDIFITPKSVGAPTGNIGEITTEIVNATSFKVYNTGDSTGEFSYLVTNS